MMWPVAVLAVLAVVGGFLQVPGGWAGVDTWLEPVAESVDEVERRHRLVLGALRARARAPRHPASPGSLYGRASDRPARIRARLPWAQRTLEHKLYFDEAYDYAFYEPASRFSLALARYVERPVFLRPLGEIAFEVRVIASKRLGRPDRHGAHLRPRGRRRPRRPPSRLRLGELMLTTALILVPIAAALVLWLLPWTARAAGGFALLVALADLAVWVVAVQRFDFDARPLQLDAHAVWLEDIGIAYRVGMFDFSLWLIGLTAVVTVAAVAYGALGGTRAGARLLRAPALPRRSDDRRLRRAGPDPLLRLLRVDADPALRADRRLGRRRTPGRDAQVHRLHDGGLALHARLDHRARPRERDVRHDALRDERQRLDLPRLHGRVRRQGAALAVPRLAAGRLPRGAARGRRAPLRRHLEDGDLRDDPDRPPVLPRARRRVAAGRHDARGDRARLRLAARVPRAGRPRRDRVLEPRADVPDRPRASSR